MKRILPTLILGLTLGLPAWADMNHMSHGNAASHAGMGETMSDGLVRKVDKALGKMTIRHGPLMNLDMPPMTMVFRVQDPSLLDRVKQGDNIRFQAERVNGVFTVIKLETVK